VSAELRTVSAPDPRDGEIYVMSDDLELAIDVALATRRPLLLRGEPGSGKSSLAPYVARTRSWRYYEHVITSRTQTTDLLWEFDAVRRLGDAQRRIRERLDDFRYVQPGALWWAMAPGSAARRGAATGVPDGRWIAADPNATINEGRSRDHAVVLIDEIDKADPDVPNGLLVPLGSIQFVVAETNATVEQEQPGGHLLVVITTNEERELPQALLRRCVVVTLPPPTRDRLVTIAQEHITRAYGEYTAADQAMAAALADELSAARREASERGLRAANTAEYLDAVHACRTLGVAIGSVKWARLRGFLLIKSQQPG
jgi:MoxR-like ATPase